MYKEEFTDALKENDPNLSSENTQEITEIEEQQTESSSNNGHVSGVASSSMGQSAVSDRFMMVTDMTRNGSGGMSLTLGIQNTDARGDVPMSGGIDNYENSISGTDFQYLNSRNHQHRIGSSQLLHDFVA